MPIRSVSLAIGLAHGTIGNKWFWQPKSQANNVLKETTQSSSTTVREANDFDLVVRRVLYKDLKINSPYNTYKNRGLPPGPITMPDISSVDAVLNAESHNYLFFVVDPKNPGYHLFASTYSEHIANRKVYVRWLNENRIIR